MMEPRIEETAEKLFFTYGLKSVSMDDIAREAGVSKKTIYQYFRDKNTVVLSIISKLVAQQEDLLKQSLKISENAIHEVILIAENVQTLMGKLRPVMLYDLHKYFPESWKLIKQFKEKSLKDAFIQNLEKGISEGLFRKDLDFEIISQFELMQFDSFFNSDSYPAGQFKSQAVISQITRLFLYGVGSAEGQVVIKKYFENQNNEYN